MTLTSDYSLGLFFFQFTGTVLASSNLLCLVSYTVDPFPSLGPIAPPRTGDTVRGSCAHYGFTHYGSTV